MIRFLALLSLTLWWGGLTFYAAVVVPIGADAFGSTGQGFVTQQVTHWLNGFALVSLLLCVVPVFQSRRRWLVGVWTVLLITLVSLALIHRQLDTLLDSSSKTVLEPNRFYSIHRAYLWITAIQWLAGICCYSGLLKSPKQDSPTTQKSGF